ncbi:hypothetical protein ACHWQZ_G017095 [Mnemiopsis leidyi]
MTNFVISPSETPEQSAGNRSQEVTETELYHLASREENVLAPSPADWSPGPSRRTVKDTPNRTVVSRSEEFAGELDGLSAGKELLPKSNSLVSLDGVLCEATDPEIEGYKRLFKKKFKKIPPMPWR